MDSKDVKARHFKGIKGECMSRPDTSWTVKDVVDQTRSWTALDALEQTRPGTAQVAIRPDTSRDNTQAPSVVM